MLVQQCIGSIGLQKRVQNETEKNGKVKSFGCSEIINLVNLDVFQFLFLLPGYRCVTKNLKIVF